MESLRLSRVAACCALVVVACSSSSQNTSNGTGGTQGSNASTANAGACGVLWASTAECNKCLADHCCDVGKQCEADATCKACWSASTPDPSCDANAAYTSVSRCAEGCAAPSGPCGQSATPCYAIECSSGCPSQCVNSQQQCAIDGKCGKV